jgi:hypothetical protein
MSPPFLTRQIPGLQGRATAPILNQLGKDVVRRFTFATWSRDCRPCPSPPLPCPVSSLPVHGLEAVCLACAAPSLSMLMYNTTCVYQPVWHCCFRHRPGHARDPNVHARAWCGVTGFFPAVSFAIILPEIGIGISSDLPWPSAAFLADFFGALARSAKTQRLR